MVFWKNKKEKENYKYGDPFKFKEIKIYASSEWMVNSTRKYRRVFDKNELTYIRAELVFYNKLFDEEEWEAEVHLKAYSLKRAKKELICDEGESLTVKKDQNMISYYQSWGNDTRGDFWEKGNYVWEAYIDGKFIGSQTFFVEDVGEVTAKENPYFQVESLRLFTGDGDAWKKTDRKYLKQFSRNDTKYVWAEFKIKNKTNSDWNLEYFVNINDDAGQPKARIESLKFIEKDTKNKIYTFDRGWGSEDGGTWKDDKYTVEIVFMDTLVAATAFKTGENDIEGQLSIATVKPQLKNLKEADSSSKTLADVIQNLTNLIGLNHVKKKINDHINYLDFLKLRKEKGFSDSDEISLHSVFTGNPGTGKTTVVKLLGEIYHKMGLLSDGEVHEVDRADLVGEYIGQTAPRTKEAIEKARGGILFVDEAYMLVRSNDDPKDFGREVIEILIKEMSDGEGDIAIMVAGYPKEMETFINANPGMKSRFKHYFHFDDYQPDELIAISESACKLRDVNLSPAAAAIRDKLIVEAYRNRDHTFGNARYAISLIDEGKMNLGLRLMKRKNVKKLSKKTLSLIKKEDMEMINHTSAKKKVSIAIDDYMLREALAELNSLVGMLNIKKEVNELVKLVRYYRETGKDVLNRFSLHTVFMGNPGTGKTTVARIIGKVYKALGLLERGHVVETGRDGLVAGYTGQTAIKAKEKIDEAQGGVLFIDEAYSLTGSGSGGYGGEAIEVILRNMENRRGEFAVIAAGYPQNMEAFLRANPGLKSRFDRTLHFEDFSPEELSKIAVYMLQSEKLTLNAEAESHLKSYLKEMYRRRDRFFGNARMIRRTIDRLVKKQNLRMASLDAEERTPETIETVTYDDVKEFQFEGGKKAGAVGF